MQDRGLVDHCLELLAPLGRTRAGRMFSGYGLYVDDLCIALVLRDTLYLKVDDAHRAAFEAAGSRPFTYEDKQGGTHVISYYAAPGEAMESPAEMRPWARRALEAAVAARAKAPARRKQATPAGKASAAGKKAAAKTKAPAAATTMTVPAKSTRGEAAAKPGAAKKSAPAVTPKRAADAPAKQPAPAAKKPAAGPAAKSAPRRATAPAKKAAAKSRAVRA